MSRTNKHGAAARRPVNRRVRSKAPQLLSKLELEKLWDKANGAPVPPVPPVPVKVSRLDAALDQATSLNQTLLDALRRLRDLHLGLLGNATDNVPGVLDGFPSLPLPEPKIDRLDGLLGNSTGVAARIHDVLNQLEAL